MIFAIIQDDRTGDTGAIRSSALAPHKEYLAAHQDKVLLAGPMLDAEGERVGSFTLVSATDHAAAVTYAEDDPFTRSGIFANSRVVQVRLGPDYLKRLQVER